MRTDQRQRIDLSHIDEKFRVIVGKVNQAKAEDAIEEHIHPESFEIVYIVRGEQVYTVCGQKYTIKSGELFMTLPNEQHSSGDYPEDKSQLYYFICHRDVLQVLGFDPIEAAGLTQILMEAPGRVFLGNSSIQQTLEELLTLFHRPSSYQKTRIQTVLSQYLFHVIGCIEAKPSQVTNVLEPVLDYIETHVSDRIAIRDLAQLMGLSESRFKACFRTKVGLPPGEYILRRKILVSKQLLESSEKSITEIAIELGFSSSQYFSTVFKRFTTLTPLEYRMAHKST